MGNLCGKESKDDNFQGPGRTLGSAPPPSNNAKASIPANVKTGGSAKPAPKVGGPPRTLGGAGDASGSAQSAAAAAAEVGSLEMQHRGGTRATKPMMTTVWM